MAGPWEKFQPPADGPWSKFSDSAQAGSDSGSDGGFLDGVAALGGALGKGVGNVALGAQKYLGKGLQAVGADTAGNWLVNDADTGKAKLAAELEPYKQRHPLVAGAGELGGEIISTLPVGGVLAKGAAKAASYAPSIASKIEPLIESIRTSGFRTGAAPATMGASALNLGTRAAGGAITGGVSSGLIDDNSAGTGAAIGAVLPGVLSVAGAGGRLAGRAYRSMKTPADAALADKLAEIIGAPRDELVSALQAQGPQMIPGYQMTVPQIVQHPAISQLQRTLQTAGVHDVSEAAARQQGQYRAALDSIAPADLSIRDAANRAGSAIQSYAVPARDEISKLVTRAFDDVDPLDKARLFLPLDQMQGAQAKYLGPGTFGTGSKAQAAIDAAHEVGMESADAVKPISAKGIQDLVLAVRAAGGINTTSKAGQELAGEIRNLRESGLNNIVRPNTGKSVERMAETMHEAGFLPDNDPATLLDLLHQSAGGDKVFKAGSERAFQRMSEQAMGQPPGAQSYDVTVPFRTLQNLRSSIGEAADQAGAKGANKEAAALGDMKRAIDSRIRNAAYGTPDSGEFFPPDVAKRYRDALDLHAAKKSVFDTGPQASIFRRGGDGQPLIQGAEIPGKFYNGNLSQVEDMQAFKRLVGGDPGLTHELKRYAMTEAQATANRAGDLTSKFNNWELSRSGANRELLNPGEQALLGEVGKAVKRAGMAEDLGRVSGSDTAQKLASINSLGALDNKVVNVIASRVPLLGKFTGPMLDSLRETAARTRNKRLGELLADPNKLAAALDSGGPEATKINAWLNSNLVQRVPYQLAPVIGSH